MCCCVMFECYVYCCVMLENVTACDDRMCDVRMWAFVILE